MRACQCSFCRKHDALSTSDPAGQIHFEASESGKLRCYRFGLKTADFLTCVECGVYIGAVINTEKGCWGIINTHALSNVPENIAAVAPMNYEEEGTENRMARREDRWTPGTVSW